MRFYKFEGVDEIHIDLGEMLVGWKYDGLNWIPECSPFAPDSDETLSMEEASQMIASQYKSGRDMIIAAQSLAKKAHAGQTDKAGADYYSGHLSTVANNTNSLYGTVVGYLHDILEDTDVTEEELLSLFPLEIVEAVSVMTHRKGESYDDYIARVKKNPIAREVKMADLMNNMDLSRLPSPTEKDVKRVLKYSQALAYLAKKGI